MTKVEQILNRFKNHPIMGIVIVIGIVIISLATFKDALQNLFGQSDEKTPIEFKVLVNSATEPLPANVRLTNDAWKAYDDKKYEQAIKKAEECINEFEGDAIPEQEELEKSNAPLPPLDKVNEEVKKVIFSRGLLNDVATCWLIKGFSLEKLGKIQEAIKAYCKAAKFTYARTYDKSEGGFFWSPSKKAKNRISYLKGQCE